MKTRIIFILSSIMLFTAQLGMAQTPPSLRATPSELTMPSLPGTPPQLTTPGLPGNPPQVPIDGGLGFLAVAGGAYAIKKLRDKKNRSEELE